jgi:hypothetical protein
VNLIKTVDQYGKSNARWSWRLYDYEIRGFSDDSVVAQGTADDRNTAERAVESVRRLMEAE